MLTWAVRGPRRGRRGLLLSAPGLIVLGIGQELGLARKHRPPASPPIPSTPWEAWPASPHSGLLCVDLRPPRRFGGSCSACAGLAYLLLRRTQLSGWNLSAGLSLSHSCRAFCFSPVWTATKSPLSVGDEPVSRGRDCSFSPFSNPSALTRRAFTACGRRTIASITLPTVPEISG